MNRLNAATVPERIGLMRDRVRELKSAQRIGGASLKLNLVEKEHSTLVVGASARFTMNIQYGPTVQAFALTDLSMRVFIGSSEIFPGDATYPPELYAYRDLQLSSDPYDQYFGVIGRNGATPRAYRFIFYVQSTDLADITVVNT